jgi:hypothetical protein
MEQEESPDAARADHLCVLVHGYVIVPAAMNLRSTQHHPDPCIAAFALQYPWTMPLILIRF